MTPIDTPEAPSLAQLRAAGDADGPPPDLDDPEPPIELEPGQESPSAVVAQLRADER